MQYRRFGMRLAPLVVLIAVALVVGIGHPATAGGKLGLYGVRMVPYGDDAEDYSKTAWGGGFHVVVPAPQLANVLAGVAGFEYIDFLSSQIDFQDPVTTLRTEQVTSQDYMRFYLGPQIGGHGNGFLRPHAGINVAVVSYGIKTEVRIPDDYDPDREIRQDLRDERKTVFGYDFTLGLDLNFSNKVAVDGGVRYLKSFSVPQQLGEGSVKVHPQYFQIYLGVAVPFEQFKGK
jgi:opacity protein-like surface antigen